MMERESRLPARADHQFGAVACAAAGNRAGNAGGLPAEPEERFLYYFVIRAYIPQ
jgi:hypothetical protein